MAFPTIPTAGAGRLLSTVATAPSGTHTSPSLSSLTKNSGDLLIAIVIIYDGNSTNAEFSAWGGGFTEFGDFAGTATMGIGCAYKWSTGSETGTFTVTSADATTNDSAFFLMSIPGAHASTPPEAGSFATGTGSSNPASFNPTGWGTEDTLWIAVGGSGETAAGGTYTGITAAPANYSDYADSGISADVVGGVEGAVAFRQLNAASEDVGTFTKDTSNARDSALVIAVRPAPPPVTTYAQAQARIKQTYRGFGQAQTTIRFEYAFGQAVALIRPIVILDTFTGANGTDLDGHLPDINQGDAWHEGVAGQINIQSNSITPTGEHRGGHIQSYHSNGILYATLNAFSGSVDTRIQLDFRAADVDEFDNNWRAWVYRSSTGGYCEIGLEKTVAGVNTEVYFDDTQTGFSTGPHEFRVSFIDNEIKLYFDSVLQTTETDSDLNTLTRVGLGFSNGGAGTIDNYTLLAAPEGVSDTFTRSVSNDWGEAEKGGTWTITTGTAADFDVGGTTGTIANANAAHGVQFSSVLLPNNVETLFTYSLSANPNTDEMYLGISHNYGSLDIFLNSNNSLFGYIYLNAPSALSIVIGPDSGIGDVATGTLFTYVPNDQYFFKFRTHVTRTSSKILAKTWKVGDTEPGWQAVTGSLELVPPGHPGIWNNFFGATNTPTWTIDNFSIYNAPPVQHGQAQASIGGAKRAYGQASALINGTFTSVVDTFTRSVSDGFSTADTGGAYTLYGTAANFDIGGATATVADWQEAVGVHPFFKAARLPNVLLPRHSEFYIMWSIPSLPSSATYNVAMFANIPSYWADFDGLTVGAYINSAGDLNIYAAGSAFNNQTNIATYTPGDQMVLKGRIISAGGTARVYAKTWKVGDVEPGWQVSTLSTTFIHRGNIAVTSGGAPPATVITVTLDNFNAYSVSPVSHANAQASIKATRYGHAQAQAKISPFRGYGQAAALINGQYTTVTDTFTRSVSDAWGTSDNAGDWSILLGTATDFDVNGTTGTIANIQNTTHSIQLPEVMIGPNVESIATISFSALPDSGNVNSVYIVHALFSRGTPTLVFNGHQGRINIESDGALKTQQLIGSSGSGQFTVGTYVPNDLYYLKIRTLRASTTSTSMVKAWKVGDVEPGWQLINSPFSNANPGHVGIAVISDSTVSTNFTIDDYNVYTAYPVSHGQAQADILASTTRYGLAQAQADIKQTYYVHAQAQADIKATSYRHAQVQADIEQTYYVHAQALTETAVGPGPIVIKETLTLNDTNVTSHTITIPPGVIAGDLLVVTGSMDFNTNPTVTWDGALTPLGNPFQPGVDANGVNIAILAAYRIATGGESGTWTVTTTGSERSVWRAYRIINWHGITPPEISFFDGSTNNSPDSPSLTVSWTNDTSLFISIASVDGVHSVTAYPSGYLYTRTDIHTDGFLISARKTITSSSTENPGASTFDGATDQWVSATIGIRGLSYYAFAQAQAEIKQTYFVHANAQARIKQTYYGLAQAQADIEATIYQHAQARADIKNIATNFSNPYAQAQADIKQIYYVHAQAQAWIENTYYGFAQARANIEQTYFVHAQAQANIEATPYRHAQANADIKNISVAYSTPYAQAQARIKQTYRTHAQAQANIEQAYYGHGQAQAKINAYNINAFAQARAREGTGRYIWVRDTFSRSVAGSWGTPDIGNIYRVFADEGIYDLSINGVEATFINNDPSANTISNAFFTNDNLDIHNAETTVEFKFEQFIAGTDINGHIEVALRNDYTFDRGIAAFAHYNDIIGAEIGWYAYSPEGSDGNNTSVTIVTDTYYVLKLRVFDRKVSVKFWERSDPEPESWLFDIEISEIFDFGGSSYIYVTSQNNTIVGDGSVISDVVDYYEVAEIFNGGFAQAQAKINVYDLNGFGQAGARIGTGRYIWVKDTFTRSESGTWGDPDIGNTYRIFDDFGDYSLSVNGSEGTIVNNDPGLTSSVFTYQTNDNLDIYNAETTVEFQFIQVAPGDESTPYIEIALRNDFEEYNRSIVAWAASQPSVPSQTKVGWYAFSESDADDRDFVVEILPDTYYVLKLRVYGRKVALKFWKRSDPEPTAWTDDTTLVSDFVPGGSSYIYIESNDQTFGDGSITRTGVDYYEVVEIFTAGFAQAQASIKATSYRHAQAQASIKQTYYAHAQAQAMITAGYNAHAQAQADIKQTYHGHAQAQANIEQTYYVHAQAQADIKQTYHGLAQAQANIEQTYYTHAQAQAKINAFNVNGYGQAQANIKAVGYGWAQANANIKNIATAYSNPYGQAQADIRTTYYVHAQAQALIKNTYYAHANAQANIEQTYYVHSQAQADIKQIYWGHAQAQANIENTYYGLAQAQADIRTTYYAHATAQADIKQVYYGHANAQANIEQTYYVHANAQADIEQTYYVFAQAQADIKQVYYAHANAQANIENTYYVHANAQANIEAEGYAFAQAQADILTSYYAHAQAQAKINAYNVNAHAQAQALLGVISVVHAQTQAKINAYNVNAFGQAQADILAQGYGFGQAQANIEAFGYGLGQAQADIKQTYYEFAQAQADIKQTYYAHSQAQANIENTYYGLGQAQANIEQTYYEFAQAQANIKATYYGLAQAQANIESVGYGLGQAQADIEQTYYEFGQAQASIKQTYYGLAQAQANILTTYYAHGQANAWIENTYYGHGQAQANILAQGYGFGQAQAKINAYDVNAHANAQALIAGESNVHAQAQAKINAYNVNGFGQAQANIEAEGYGWAQAQANILNTYYGHGQSQADIKQTSYSHGQAQADIKQIYWGHGQAQANIEQTYNEHGQAQADIKATSYGHGQAQAEIKQTYWGHGQAQANIEFTGYGHGQAQSDIKATSYGHGQANAWIENTYYGHANAQAEIVINVVRYYGHAQAQADIEATGYGHGQAQGDIKQTYNSHAQAQANIENTYYVWAQAQGYIKRTEYGLGQAQADIENTYNVHGQAQASIKQIYVQCAQAQAHIENTYQAHGQANAYIRITQQGYGQAQAYSISGGFGFAQAKAQILQLNDIIIKTILLSDSNAISLTLSSSIPPTLDMNEPAGTLTLSDRAPMALTLSDRESEFILYDVEF